MQVTNANAIPPSALRPCWCSANAATTPSVTNTLTCPHLKLCNKGKEASNNNK